MLTLKEITKVSRMMHQTGNSLRGNYIMPHEFYSRLPIPNDSNKIVKLSLSYELGSDGDVRIVHES